MPKVRIQQRTTENKFTLTFTSEYGNQCGVSLVNVNYVKITNLNRLVYVNGRYLTTAHPKTDFNVYLDLICLGQIYNLIVNVENGDTNIMLEWLNKEDENNGN